MITTKAQLEKMKNQLAFEHCHPGVSLMEHEKDIVSERERYFKAGFDACLKLMLEREKVLREALEDLKPMTAMRSHQTFREGKDGPIKTELLPTPQGKVISEALAAVPPLHIDSETIVEKLHMDSNLEDDEAYEEAMKSETWGLGE